MLIRLGNSSDINQVVLIETERNLSFWGSEGYKEALQNKTYLLTVCEAQEKIVGFALSRFLTSSEAELVNIGVRKGFEKRGVGKKLLEFLLHNCLKTETKEVWLEVRKSNQRAINFYRENGFEIFGVRRNLYQLPTEDAILMKLTLDSLTQI